MFGYQGNSAVIQIVESGYSPKLRHFQKVLKINIGSIHEFFSENETAKLFYIKTAAQCADPFTKPLPVAKWIEDLQQMNVHIQIRWFLQKLSFSQAFSIAQCKTGAKKKYRRFQRYQFAVIKTVSMDSQDLPVWVGVKHIFQQPGWAQVSDEKNARTAALPFALRRCVLLYMLVLTYAHIKFTFGQRRPEAKTYSVCPCCVFLSWCILTVRRWYFDEETAQIRSEYDHQCLDVNMGGSANVYIHVCHDGDNQKFVPRSDSCAVRFVLKAPKSRPLFDLLRDCFLVWIMCFFRFCIFWGFLFPCFFAFCFSVFCFFVFPCFSVFMFLCFSIFLLLCVFASLLLGFSASLHLCFFAFWLLAFVLALKPFYSTEPKQTPNKPCDFCILCRYL